VLQLLRSLVVLACEGYRLTNPDAIQHINLKVLVEKATAIELADAVVIFHRWIREGVCPEMLIDVADYRHVPAGPGVLLIGHEANYSLDNRENRLGLLYNRKSSLEGNFQSRLEQAHRAALEACDRLESEVLLRGKLRFNRNVLEVSINDRLLAPNNDQTWRALQPELEKFFAGFTIERLGEPRDLFRVAITRNGG
jgi:hypothetical protein